MVAKAVKSNPGNASHPKVVEKLKSILKAIPNHESALLVASAWEWSRTAAVFAPGSFNVIEKRAARLSASLNDGLYGRWSGRSAMGEYLPDWRALRNQVDPRTRPYLDSFLKTSSFIRQHRSKAQFTAQIEREFRQVLGGIDIERNKLVNNREIQEELMDE